MRDKFRKSANSLSSSKPSERSDRGRPREREHRQGQKERSRDCEFTKHKSRSPFRSSKLSAPSATTTSISRNLDNVADRTRKVDRNLDSMDGNRGGRVERKRVAEHEDDRARPRSERESLLKGKLRMDRGGGGDRERESRNKQATGGGSNIISRFQELARSGERDSHPRKQPPGELDRVVQRAKEERSSYWNKRVIEAEEKDPNRWGHSGFKELYRRDMKSPPRVSPTNNSKHFRGSPSERHHQRHRERHVPRRSRSRSPRNKSGNSRNELRRSITPPKQQRSSNPNFVPLGPRQTTTGMRKISPLLSRVLPERKSDRDRRSRDYGNTSSATRVDSGGGEGKSSRNSNLIGGDSVGRRTAALNEKSFGSKSGSGGGGSRNVDNNSKGSTNDSYRRNDRDRSDKRDKFRDSSSMSNSRSRSRSTPSPLPPRSSGNVRSSKGISDQKSKDSRTRTKTSSKVATLGSRSRSKSMSSSSSSSEDEDVLQLHADDRRKGRGASSISRSSSSSTDSKTSSSSQISSSKRKAASDSSSSSSSDSDSDDDSDVSGKISMEKTRKSGTTESNKTKETAESGAYKSKSSSDLKSSESRTGTKRPSSSATTATASKAPRSSTSKTSTSASKSSRDKEKTTTTTRAGSKGESESDSGSESSDSEPRMTLSERFAKLTQMSTDKREFAKPLLSVNEIDTKLKVVKDLRNADMKIYVEGPHGLQQQQQQRSTGSSTTLKPRPKSPEYAYAEGEKRYTSDERRRHFERMERDEPRDSARPADWSDTRVRFEYYRDRGYFSDRPLSFEEYVKWEEWWYQYRDWLQHEGYYNTRVPAGAVPPRPGGNFSGGEGSRQSRNGDWNQPSGMSSPRLRLRPGLLDIRESSPGRRVEQVSGGRLVPLSSRPHFIGSRPDDRGNGMPRLMDTRPRIISRGGGGGGFGRAIGRAPGGSLIVNIRQGSSNYGPRGRHVGLLRGRNR